MPWARMTHERKMKVYKDILGDMIVGKRDLDLTIHELLVRAEILKHDFTKRQMTILMFIFTFSFAYGKDSAYIPKLQDFEIAGVSKTKIKAELNQLVKMNVIEWNQEEMVFKIKDTSTWEVPYNAGYNDVRSNELFILNLEHSGYDVSGLMKKLKEEL